jgi:hypothetical protein
MGRCFIFVGGGSNENIFLILTRYNGTGICIITIDEIKILKSFEG